MGRVKIVKYTFSTHAYSNDKFSHTVHRYSSIFYKYPDVQVKQIKEEKSWSFYAFNWPFSFTMSQIGLIYSHNNILYTICDYDYKRSSSL